MPQGNWLTEDRTGWEFKGPGLKAGAEDMISALPKGKPFECIDCSKKYTHAHNLEFHQLWSCKKRQQPLEVNETRRPMSSNVFSESAQSEVQTNPRRMARQYKVEIWLQDVVSVVCFLQVFKCSVCSEPFETLNAVKKHKKDHHKV